MTCCYVLGNLLFCLLLLLFLEKDCLLGGSTYEYIRSRQAYIEQVKHMTTDIYKRNMSFNYTQTPLGLDADIISVILSSYENCPSFVSYYK